MKKYFLMAVALFVGAVTFTSCGDDEEDELQKAAEAIINGENSVSMNENGDVMTLTINYANVYVETHKATFESASDSAMVKSYIMTQTYANKTLADAAEQAYKEVDDEEEVELSYKRSGNTFTFDLTDEFKRYTKSDIRVYFNIYKENAEKAFGKE